VIPGRVLPTGREIAWHEAHHAAARCLAGMVPKSVRSDWPSNFEAGAVTIDWGPGGHRDPARAKDVLVSIVVGALTEGKQGWDRENWPIPASATSCSGISSWARPSGSTFSGGPSGSVDGRTSDGWSPSQANSSGWKCWTRQTFRH
jgi:hypothetical protein